MFFETMSEAEVKVARLLNKGIVTIGGQSKKHDYKSQNRKWK